jgi:DNA-binding MarR family transcriptional regulator
MLPEPAPIAESAEPASPSSPTLKQAAVLTLIARYHDGTGGDACSAAYLARKLGITRATMRTHLQALYEKGWLRSPASPATLRVNFLKRGRL